MKLLALTPLLAGFATGAIAHDTSASGQVLTSTTTLTDIVTATVTVQASCSLNDASCISGSGVIHVTVTATDSGSGGHACTPSTVIVTASETSTVVMIPTSATTVQSSSEDGTMWTQETGSATASASATSSPGSSSSSSPDALTTSTGSVGTPGGGSSASASTVTSVVTSEVTHYHTVTSANSTSLTPTLVSDSTISSTGYIPTPTNGTNGTLVTPSPTLSLSNAGFQIGTGGITTVTGFVAVLFALFF